MNRENSDYEEADIVEEPSSDHRHKKVVVYGQYDKHFHSPLRRKSFHLSVLDILV
jgi:hypothetical protein